MSSSFLLAILSAATLGAAAVAIVTAFLPRLPKLTELLATTPTPSHDQTRTESTTDTQRSVFERIGQTRLVHRIPGPAIPYRDLDLLGYTPNRFLGYQAGFALAGLLMPTLLGALARWLSLPLPISVPLLFGIACAVVGWLLPHLTLRRDAAAARARFGRAVTSYIDLVVLERLAGAGVASSVVEAAEVARAPLFLRIQETLLRRRLERQPPHAALRELADNIDLPELHELANTLTIAAHDSPVTESLQAKARTIRNTYLARDVEQAGQASQRQTAATALLLMCFLAFLGTPVVIRLLTS